MIISLLSEKGGVGKTTLAINISYCLQSRGNSVLLVDSDPQGSARDWNERNDGEILNIIGLDRITLDKDIIKFKKKYDYIIIDGAPQLKDLAVRAILCSDLVLIPCQPSSLDTWASKHAVELIKQRQAIADNTPKAAFVVSREIVGTSVGKELREVLRGYELPVFKSGTYQRIAYSETIAEGKTVMQGGNGLAISEINLIVDEVLECLS